MALSFAGCSLRDLDYLGQDAAMGDDGSRHDGDDGDDGEGPIGTTGGGDVGASSMSGIDASTGGALDDNEPSPDGTSGGAEPGATAGADDGDDESNGDVVPGGDGMLINGSFESGYTGWTIDPPSAQGEYAFIQWPTSGSTTPDGQNQMATWHESDSYAVSIFQRVEGLADGTYTFTGHFYRGEGHNATDMFVRNCGGADIVEHIPSSGPTDWIQFEITGIEVTGGSCDVGFFVDANPGDWLNADLFTLVRDE